MTWIPGQDEAVAKASGYSLKAACSHCGQWGTIDDGSLICFRCGRRHGITPEQERQRAADIAVWSLYSRRS